MTALDAYARLEAEGRYRARADAEPETVILSFGEASLTMMRIDETPVAHWPLASIVCVDAAGLMTLAPDETAEERLEIDDAEMIAAIRAVGAAPAIQPVARRRRRRLVRRLAAAALLCAVGFGAWTQAPRLAEPIASTAPPAARAALGGAAIMAHARGAFCASAEAEAALRTLARRFRAVEPGAQTAFWAATVEGEAVAAPGGQVLMPARVLGEGVEALALAAATALARAQAESPFVAAVRDAGIRGYVEVLTGALTGPALTRAAAARLAAPQPAADPERVAAILAAAGLDAAPETALSLQARRALVGACAD
ncbi:MAG: hypothetical protein EA355_11345 [Rhodobacteraceae bacterium]|nr:MAG: hypothetical protein EA355_11345 [Paracoccaceae bacterium]